MLIVNTSSKSKREICRAHNRGERCRRIDDKDELEDQLEKADIQMLNPGSLVTSGFPGYIVFLVLCSYVFLI
jgi:hypothetical protein